MKTNRNFFPIGTKGVVSFEDVPTVTRDHRRINVGGIEHVFDNNQDAIEAFDEMWKLYDEEQQLRNSTLEVGP